MVNTIRVAVVLSGGEQFGPYFGGAVARWTYEVYRRISPWIVPVIFGDPTPSSQRYSLPFETSSTWLPTLVAKIPYLRRSQDSLWLRQFASRLREFDIVHLQNRPHWAPLLRKAGYRGKIVGHLHNGHLANWSGPDLDRLALQIDCVASCSNFIASTFTQRSQALAERSVVIYNGVDLDVFKPAPTPRIPKQIFFVGRFDEQKGVLPLVQAFESVLAHHPDAELVIGGSTGFGTHIETAYVRSVRAAAEKLLQSGNFRISFPGYVDHDRDLPHYFRQAAVAVFPSVFEEPFGMVVCEAMACGTPVIATRRGGIPEVLGNSGLIVAEPEPPELCNAIHALLSAPRELERMSCAGLNRVQNFRWEALAARWTSILEHVAAERSLEDFHLATVSDDYQPKLCNC